MLNIIFQLLKSFEREILLIHTRMRMIMYKKKKEVQSFFFSS